jgi:hypothetical protein
MLVDAAYWPPFGGVAAIGYFLLTPVFGYHIATASASMPCTKHIRAPKTTVDLRVLRFFVILVLVSLR